MTVTVDGVGRPPWGMVEVDPGVVLAEAQRMLPGVVAWAGEFTGSFWLLRGDRLEEFRDPRALLTRIGEIAVPARLASRSSGAWSPDAGRQGAQSGAAGPSRARTVGQAVRPRPAHGATHTRANAIGTHARRVSAEPAIRPQPTDLFFPPPGRFRRLLERCRQYVHKSDDCP
ncbi:hypothetical protein [Actinomadura bangladeshensis]|uniref:Uncharacterized protein n=1 Tax=Actinomadura bangladeshensis TaxID=453573 RepID=A0A4R4P173_9ACTN|nr:hypothetical protein [Actinomadura bangladeshensis]TDC15655.1 hypothetical protein E1284_14910 [Actinomadura bangladeshensis]